MTEYLNDAPVVLALHPEADVTLAHERSNACAYWYIPSAALQESNYFLLWIVVHVKQALYSGTYELCWDVDEEEGERLV